MPFAINAGITLFYRLDGEARKPALLLLNAIGTDHTLWDRLVPLLEPDFRILRMDGRGHGQSDAPAGDYDLGMLAGDALAVMDAAGIPSASVCGLSLGGMIAMTLALEAPTRIEAIVLACTSAAMDSEAWDARITHVRSSGTAAITEMALERCFATAFRLEHPAIVDIVRGHLLAMKRDGYVGCGAAIRDMALLPHLHAIAQPTLVIAGSKDVSTPYEGHGDKIVAAIPHARAKTLDAAHLVALERPASMAEAIRSFLLDVLVPALPPESANSAVVDAAGTLFEAGLKNRRAVLGDAYVDRALGNRTPFTADFQAMVTRIAWQEVWGRPGLDHRTRRLLVVVITASLGRWEEFRLHVKAGLEQGGFTEAELKEALMQTAIYAGVPAANTAFAEAAAILKARDEPMAS